MTAQTLDSSTCPPARRRPLRSALGLLLFSLAIPLCSWTAWRNTGRIEAEYRLRMLALSLDRDAAERAQEHLRALLGLGVVHLQDALVRMRDWPWEDRHQIAQMVLDECGLDGRTVRGFSLRSEAEARKVLEAVLELAPDHPEALQIAATVAMLEDDYVRAADCSRRFLAAAPAAGESVMARLQLAEVLLRMDQYVEAEEQARQVIEEARTLMLADMARHLLGLALQRQGRYRDAIVVVSEMLVAESAQEQQELLVWRGHLFGLQGRHDLAALDLQAALARCIRPEEQLALRRAVADALGKAGQVEAALQELDRVIQRTGLEPELLFLRAQILADNGRGHEAIRDFEEALVLLAEKPVLLNNYAWFLLTAKDETLRDPERAVSLARMAVQLDDRQNPAYLDTLAESLYASGRFGEAAVFEQEALEKGGETFRPSLERFQTAAADAAAGRPVTIERSLLADHHLAPLGDRGEPFDVASLPSIARLAYQRDLETLLLAGPLDLNAAAQRLATIWQKTPPSATDDPREELSTFCMILFGFESENRRSLVAAGSAERLLFLRDLEMLLRDTQPDAEAERQQRLWRLLERRHRGEVPARQVLHPAAQVVARLLKTLGTEQVGTLLHALADGGWQFSELLVRSGSDGGDGNATPLDESAAWLRVREKLLRLADGRAADGAPLQPDQSVP